MINNLRILSLGAGVQSSTLALMINKGEVPMVDAAIFADTGGEPKAVYDWLEWLTKQLSYPVYIVSKGNLREDMINAIDGKYKFLSVPLFTRNAETGKKGLLRRQCTADYKILPVNQKVRELLGLEKGEKRKKGTSVEMLMGISMDEIYRVKPNRVKYITNVYPLIDLKINYIVDSWHWYDARLFRLYRDSGMSMREIASATTISLTSIFHTIKVCKARINNAISGEYYDCLND